MHKHSFHASSRSSSPVVARHRARNHQSRPSYRRRAGVHPCPHVIPVVATTARKMAFASARTVSDFISSMIPSVFAEARTTELRAAAAGRAVVVCARADSRGRAVGQSLGRFVSRSVHRRARALKTRGDDEENIHRATSARARVDRVARRVARTSSHAVRARSGSRARRRPFAARVTLAAVARGRSRARERESRRKWTHLGDLVDERRSGVRAGRGGGDGEHRAESVSDDEGPSRGGVGTSGGGLGEES